MKKSMLAAMVIGTLAVGLISCGKEYSRGKWPQLQVKVANDIMAKEHWFPRLLANEPASVATVEISNHGNADLIIAAIYLKPGGNQYIKLTNFSLVESDFPYTIEPNLPTPPIVFGVTFDPTSSTVDASDAVLVVETNDLEQCGDDCVDGVFTVTFRIQDVGPEIQLNKTGIIFKCILEDSSEQIIIDNNGTDVLTISNIDFGNSSSEFTIFNGPNLPVDIPPKGADGYLPVTFYVKYDPGDDDYDDANSLIITSNDPSEPGGLTIIPITVEQTPALLEFSTDSPFGYLDFSGGQGPYKIQIYNQHSGECDNLCPDKGKCCGCPIRVSGASVDPKDAADWFTITASDPATGNAIDIKNPFALKGGSAVEFQVAYGKPAGQTQDKNGKICINYNAPLAGAQVYCISALVQNQCQFELAPKGKTALFFNSSSPAQKDQKPIVLVNNGGAACTISSVKVTSDFGTVSEDFELKDGPFAGGTPLEAFSLMPIWLSYSPHTDQPQGKFVATYLDPISGKEVEEWVGLTGTKEADCAIPIANPGKPESYAGAKALSKVTLNGCSSGPGECGQPVYEKGYIWYLVAKPPNSAAMLNTEGTCITQFTPDLPGEYEVALIVYDAGQTHYQSNFASVKIQVAE